MSSSLWRLALTSALLLTVSPRLHAAPPAPEPEPQPEPTSGPDCIAIAREAARAHPVAGVFAARARAISARGRIEGAMPAPMGDFQVWNFPVTSPADAEMTMFMLGVEQRWPLANVRRAARRAGRLGADATMLEGRAALLEVAARTAHACIDWSAAERRATSLEVQRQIIQAMVDALRAAQSSGMGGIPATLRAEGELAGAQRQITTARAMARGARATLQALVAEAALPVVAPDLAAPERPLNAAPEGADETAGAVMLAMRAAMIQAADAEVRAATLAAETPELIVGGGLAYQPDQPLGLMAKIGLELPWLSSRPEAHVDAARANAAAARAELATEKRAAEAMVAAAHARLGEVQAAADALVREEIPALERAAAVERAALATGIFDLAAWIETNRALRATAVDLAELAAARAHAEIELLTATGRLMEDLP